MVAISHRPREEPVTVSVDSRPVGSTHGLRTQITVCGPDDLPQLLILRWCLYPSGLIVCVRSWRDDQGHLVSERPIECTTQELSTGLILWGDLHLRNPTTRRKIAFRLAISAAVGALLRNSAS